MLAHNESRLTDIQLQNMPRKSHNPFNIFKSFQDLSIAGNLLISTILKKVQKKVKTKVLKCNREKERCSLRKKVSNALMLGLLEKYEYRDCSKKNK